jgi:hypothetical protein
MVWGVTRNPSRLYYFNHCACSQLVGAPSSAMHASLPRGECERTACGSVGLEIPA